MDSFDSGLFLVISVLAFVFMVLSFKYLSAGAGMVFLLFACMSFFTLALILVSEIPIISETTISDGSVTWTETETLIGTANGYILGLFYMVFGIMSVGLLGWKMLPSGASDY